jgi:hypothetical protein
MSLALRNIQLFHVVLLGYLQLTAPIKALTILTTLISPYHHGHSPCINFYVPLILQFTSILSTCQLCDTVSWETKKNEVITGIIDCWISHTFQRLHTFRRSVMKRWRKSTVVAVMFGK